MIPFDEIIANMIILSEIKLTSGEKKSTAIDKSIGVGVGCLSPKLILIDEASGLPAYIIYPKISFINSEIMLPLNMNFRIK